MRSCNQLPIHTELCRVHCFKRMRLWTKWTMLVASNHKAMKYWKYLKMQAINPFLEPSHGFTEKKGAKSLLLWSRSIFLEYTNSLRIPKPLRSPVSYPHIQPTNTCSSCWKKASHTRWIPPDLEIFREMWLVGLVISKYPLWHAF